MTDGEFGSVVDLLGRAPRIAELAMYSVMWSEHCSYKSSRAWLGRFPTEAPWVVVGPGVGIWMARNLERADDTARILDINVVFMLEADEGATDGADRDEDTSEGEAAESA